MSRLPGLVVEGRCLRSRVLAELVPLAPGVSVGYLCDRDSRRQACGHHEVLLRFHDPPTTTFVWRALEDGNSVAPEMIEADSM